MEYEITAMCSTGVKLARRNGAVQALACGKEYEAQGCTDVRIKTPDGMVISLDEFASAAKNEGRHPDS